MGLSRNLRGAGGLDERIKDAVDSRANGLEIPSWLDWNETQLADQALARMYEELMKGNEYVPNSLED